MHRRSVIILAVAGLIAGLALAVGALAVSGAAFTTFNAHVDGASKDVCKNSAINCNIYGKKQYVWLNGGPTANGLGPDGQYFFAVLVPGGQPNPNDGGLKNLSDDYDAYTNRTFTVTNGEVSAYGGTHWLDSGRNEPGPGDLKPNGQPPFIRLYPYADTTNPGGVYIMSICSLADGYPVEPRDCKYDAFKVKAGKMTYQFMLDGMKFEDMNGNGARDPGDDGLAGWVVSIEGTGPDGLPISATATTGADGYWQWTSPLYTFDGNVAPGPVHLTVCEVLQDGWIQTFPTPPCHTIDFTPSGFDSFFGIDFGNYDPIDVTACKVRDLDGVLGGPTTPIEGWSVSLTKNGTIIDTQLTGADGCYTWTDLLVGDWYYDVHEATRDGWRPLAGTDYAFPMSQSGVDHSYTFVNTPLEGCTPGFWQGGNDFGTAGGKWLWNEVGDPDWAASGGMGTNPYAWHDDFATFFGGPAGEDMWYYVNPEMWVVNDDFHKAARSLVAAYLDSSWGMGYAYSTAELKAMWTDAVASGDYLALHTELDAANNAYYREGDPPHCPISASGY